MSDTQSAVRRLMDYIEIPYGPNEDGVLCIPPEYKDRLEAAIDRAFDERDPILLPFVLDYHQSVTKKVN